MFKREVYGDKELDEDEVAVLVSLTQQIFLLIERELSLTGFWERIPARARLKAELQDILLLPEFKDLPGLRANRIHLLSRILEIAERNNDIILYAE